MSTVSIPNWTVTVSSGDADDSLFFDYAAEDKRNEKWDHIDQALQEWVESAGLEVDDEDDAEQPSYLAVDAAIRYASILRDDESEAPDSVLSDGAGGIQFRWGSPIESMVALEFDAEGGIEAIEVSNGQVTVRSRFS